MPGSRATVAAEVEGYTNRSAEELPKNYPPEGQAQDTTSEGGYGGHVFMRAAQRGLIDQSTEGLPLGDELQDAYQGKDVEAAEQYENEQKRQGQGLNPYGESAPDDQREQCCRIASSCQDPQADK